MIPKSPGSSNVATTTTPTPRTPSTIRPTLVTTARKYIERDEHAIFFATPSKRRKQRQRVTKPRTNKSRTLTNKERAAFARTHYEYHHGTDPPDPDADVWAVPAPTDTPATPTPGSDIWAQPAPRPTPSPIPAIDVTPALQWSPEILGHHRQVTDDNNRLSLSLSTPPAPAKP